MNRFRRRAAVVVLLVSILFIGICTVNAQTEEISIPEVEYSHYTLDNGMEIYVFEDHQVPLVETSIWYKVGSINESEGMTGISHFLEHAMFLGTETLNDGEVSEMIEEVGGSNNASTGSWRTRYHETVPSSSLELAIAIEADRMNNMMLQFEEFEREKEVVIQERRKRVENDAFVAGQEEIQAEAFNGTPLEHNVIGFREDLESINLIDLYQYYEKYYAPNNAVLSVAGDVDPEEVYNLAEKYFSGYESRELKEVDFEFPEQQQEKEVTVRKRTEVPYIIMYYKLPRGNHPDMVAVDFLLDILLNKSTSRVTTELRQNQEILLNAGGHRGAFSVPGYAMVFLVPESEASLEKVLQGYEKELKDIIKNGVSEEELQIVKKGVAKDLIKARRNMMNFSDNVITSELKYDDPEYYRTRIKRINEVTSKDIIEAAQKYFVPENRTTGYILPKTEQSILEMGNQNQ
ncbi:MAG: M16 family metallopeptidase [Halanaerobiales bacterium]